jgi:hypothetical protein
MAILLMIFGAIAGSVLGWLFDRRILKREVEAGKNQDVAPT